ncbi:hypothetical protein ACIGQE_26375 [Streptomyces sp. NPDC053429]|uniref:hypothetical protein n=1 Tax=Streptomyces sp. NPDC053429 TaxID=3365702 RepID=UPI0037D739DF
MCNNGGGAVHTKETPATPHDQTEWPEPTDEQLAMIRRILAPRVREVRSEQGVAA